MAPVPAAIKASSSALDAVLALPLRERYQPNSSRVWQSMTSASAAQPSRPAQIRHRSVDQRSLGALATDGNAWILGRIPMARLRTYQPLIWKMCWTVEWSKRVANLTQAMGRGVLAANSLPIAEIFATELAA